MFKKHIFLSIFSKIAIFACVFCTLSALADTTTCDIDFTPVTGNSWQNGTPTPETPVAIESIGTKVGNKYAVQVAVNYDGGVVDLGTLNWSAPTAYEGIYLGKVSEMAPPTSSSERNTMFYIDKIYHPDTQTSISDVMGNKSALRYLSGGIAFIAIRDKQYTTAQEFKQAMSGVKLYYQRTTDETWTAPTLRTVYLDEPLRKVGDYADVLDYKNGTITRNVGVKVLDGTEGWTIFSGSLGNQMNYALGAKVGTTQNDSIMTHYVYSTSSISALPDKSYKIAPTASNIMIRDSEHMDSVSTWKSYLAQQYANGTPVTVYYPLATPVVEQIENWSCPVPITDIKIATTKMVDDEFAVAEANLAATVQTIESVVSRTITQTGQIATLQAEKQTRPDETCPANMKCLLVQDEDGTPHWYPIIEP